MPGAAIGPEIAGTGGVAATAGERLTTPNTNSTAMPNRPPPTLPMRTPVFVRADARSLDRHEPPEEAEAGSEDKETGNDLRGRRGRKGRSLRRFHAELTGSWSPLSGGGSPAFGRHMDREARGFTSAVETQRHL